MIKRGILMAALSVAFALPGSAETIRTLLTKENRFPELHRAEVGALVEFIEFTDNSENTLVNDADLNSITAFARYMAAEDFALTLSLPYGKLDPDFADSETGIGDVAVGFELRAFEHFFRFPYVIPHAELRFDTGEPDAALGDDQSSVLLGVTIGSQVYDEPIHLNFDFSYEVFDDSENVFIGAVSLVWDITEQFALLVEASLSDEEPPLGKVEHPQRYGAAMAYKPSDDVTISIHGGGAKNAQEDVLTALRVAWQL